MFEISAKRMLGAAIAIGCVGLAQASPNLVTNGTFDSGTTGWALSQTDGFTWSSTEGDPGGALVLNNSPGPVPQASQTISGLVVGATYEISLDAKTHYNCCNSSTKAGDGVGIDGQQFDFLIVDGQPWTPYTFDFTYTGSSDVLTLSAQRNGTDSDGEFDNVSLTQIAAVPEPSALVLAGLGLVSVALARRRTAG